MNVIEQIMSDALGHAKDIPSTAAEIRDIFKIGKERLQAVRDEAKAFADGIVSKATASLDAFKSEVEKVEKEAEGFEADAPKPADPAPVAPVVDLSSGITTHTATDGTVTTLDHDAGTVTAKDGDGVPVTPAPAAVDAVVQATVDAGVAVPETVAADAGVTVAAPEAAPVL